MAELALRDKAALEGAISKISRASSEPAKASVHLGAAMRESYLKVATAIENNDLMTAGDIIDRIRNSDLVVGTAAKFHGLRDKLNEIRDALTPWAKVIGGIVLGLIGFFFAAELGVTLAAILMICGFLYAIVAGLKTASNLAKF